MFSQKQKDIEAIKQQFNQRLSDKKEIEDIKNKSGPEILSSVEFL